MSRKIKVMSVLGTRPEAIKLAPVIEALTADSRFESIVCATAQHRQMLDQALAMFSITPAYDLDIMREGQDLFDITSGVVLGLRGIFQKEKPQVVLVQGDTTTVFAASLAAFYSNIPVGHVEAGLRTQDKRNPYPEEINRRLTTVLTDFHFAPTEWSKNNLLDEGVLPERIFVTGNTVVDALRWALRKIEDTQWPEVDQIREWAGKNIGDQRIVLITAHRRESFGQPFRDMCEAMKRIAERNPQVHLVYPVHLNPKVRDPVFEILGGISNIHLIEPMNYLPFVWLMNRSWAVLTDSGGIQEEAPSLGKPVLVMRETTERPEGIQAGTSILVGRETDTIVKAVEDLLTNSERYGQVVAKTNPYGDGTAAKKIIEILVDALS
jgi:UDP-N-acetylglucosamine 2-epimerase (non-hydrolysing)